MAVQDIKMRIPAGETLPVQKPGDFIYLKFADRQIAVIEDQSRFEMEAGDKYVSRGGFSAFQVQNLDQENPVYVIFAVGKGDYHRQIVQGEITTNIGVRTADGTFKPDSRVTESWDVTLFDKDAKSYNQWQDITTFPNETSGMASGMAMDSPERLWLVAFNSWTIQELNEAGNVVRTQNIRAGFEDQESFNTLKKIAYDRTANELYAANRFGEIQVLNADDLSYKRSIDLRGLVNGDNVDGLYASRERNELAMVVDRTSQRMYLWSLGKTPTSTNFDKELAAGNLGDSLHYYDGVYFGCTNVGGLYWVNPETGETGQYITSVGTGFSRSAIDPYSKYLWLTGDDSGTDSKFAALDDFTIATMATAEPAECSAGQLTMPEPVEIRSPLTVSQDGTRYQASGALISLIIEAVTGRLPTADYLDHVYEIEFTRTGRKVSSGGETFKAAKIEDNFTAAFPQRVRLTIDNDLEVQ